MAVTVEASNEQTIQHCQLCRSQRSGCTRLGRCCIDCTVQRRARTELRQPAPCHRCPPWRMPSNQAVVWSRDAYLTTQCARLLCLHCQPCITLRMNRPRLRFGVIGISFISGPASIAIISADRHQLQWCLVHSCPQFLPCLSGPPVKCRHGSRSGGVV